MFEALILSVRQLGDRSILAVLAKSLALTLALLATLGVGLWFAGAGIARWAGLGEGGAEMIGVASVLAGALLGWLVFRALAIAVVGIFADDVVAAVEARHYPTALVTARPVPFTRSLAMSAGSVARTLLVNVAAIPLYLLLLATGIGTPIGFFLVNALLLGRDLGDMVAARHRAPGELPAFRAGTRGRRFALGGVGTGLLLIPFVNLLAPVLGAAMATHLFHRRLSQ
ncbi:EI24 domain-containing protein [Sphingomonas sp.]|uniref:EI24 domain-containing protein n=1 Tax=Sphingomonas sp. TaxID=28214 RepID=UPI002DD64459|nr:EI24 domain-containing protein [Sphingomonas sp.]